jgi:hypothetical protein
LCFGQTECLSIGEKSGYRVKQKKGRFRGKILN